MIQPTHSSDIDNIVRLYTDERVRQYLGGPRHVDDVKNRFKEVVQTEEEMSHWTVISNETNEFLGLVTIDKHHSGKDYEISFQFLPKWWGQGLAKEAVNAVISYSFTHLKRSHLMAETQSANTRSRNLLERLGMTQVDRFTRFGAEQVLYKIEQ
ncbi:GNAT family N-acetyltransferase [Lentibacillus saliphilus]|uniref:GNAT family N-acetyltransferase n=1 Tax=Lentibacillus saliphilus TaxID=2737028 RepID=UPI001FE248AB|nr:GNAT family N-acetyltransferase [Lentibacillus saliphilus]